MAAVALTLPLGLVACEIVDETYDDFFGDEPAPRRVATPEPPPSGEASPNLGSVPSTPPQPTPGEQRRALQEGLRADRGNAEYSSQPLTPSRGSGAAPPSPDSPELQPPPRMPAPTTPPRAATTPQPSVPPAPQAAAPSPTPAPAPSPTPAPAPAAAPSPAPPPAPAAPMPAPAPAPAMAPAPGPQTAQALAPGFSGVPRQSQLVGVIYFGHSSSRLDRQADGVLRQVAGLQRQRQGSQLRLVGHASQRTGTVEPLQHNLANFNVSLRRAERVADALAGMGVAREVMIVEARGAAQPIYHEFMPTGEAGNRRVEIFLEN